MQKIELKGLVAATHTPFSEDGALKLEVVERQAAHLLDQGITTAFICGSTGESHSLTTSERLRMTERWIAVTQGSPLRVVVHVGSNNLLDAKELAAHAEKHGALAISALAPSYFKPRTLPDLVMWCEQIAAAAPGTPFYFYDIPTLTNVSLSMPGFLSLASTRVPTLNGIKFTNYDLASFQMCLHQEGGRFDIPWGVDEFLLGALALGARGAVGSSYNFAAPIYQRLQASLATNELAAARLEQFRSVQLINLLASFGYLGAAKAVMRILGVNVGPARLPNTNLSPTDISKLKEGLEKLGFFDWLEPKRSNPGCP